MAPSIQRVNGNLDIMVGMTGLEPAASWSQTTHSSQTELHPEIQFK